MNNLEVELEPDFREMSNGKLYLKVNLTIDGVCPLQCNEDDFDICELIKSTKKDGTYFIWTCDCGVAACAGYFKGIYATINGDFTTWTDKDLGKEYKFATIELKTKIQSLYEDVLKWNLHANSINAELNIWPSWTMKYLLPAINN